MADHETPQQIATQAPGEAAEQPKPAGHEQHAADKHLLEYQSDETNPPHKRYRSEPHHAILLSTESTHKTDPVISASQYVSEFLKDTTALSIIPAEERGKIEAVNASHIASEALSILSKKDKLSAPVYDKELDAYVGFVDYLDMASLVVDIVQQLLKELYPNKEIMSLQAGEKEKIVHEAKIRFNSKKIFDIADLSKTDPFMPIHKSSTLYQAIEILAKFGIHRVPIIDDDQKIEAILSQSSIVDFLFSNLDKMASKSKKKVSEMIDNRETSTVLTITESSPAFEAFELMLKNKVSAVGVVTDQGVLVGVVSGTDLRIVGPHLGSLSLLLNPVKELLDQSREMNTMCLVPVVKANLQDTLGIVIESMEDNKVHRVFVVDDNEKPICVLSMKDVLSEFLS